VASHIGCRSAEATVLTRARCPGCRDIAGSRLASRLPRRAARRTCVRCWRSRRGPVGLPRWRCSELWDH